MLANGTSTKEDEEGGESVENVDIIGVEEGVIE